MDRNRIRVLFVTHTEAMFGANHSLLRLMLELREFYNVEPTVLMPRIHKTYGERNLKLVCQQHHIESYSYRFYWFKNTLRVVSYIRCMANVVCYPYILFRMRGKRYDLIHSNGSVISLGALLSGVKKTPHVWHLREFGYEDFGLKSLLGRQYEKWIYHHADVYVAISSIIARHFSTIISNGDIVTIYNGIVPPKLFHSHRKELGGITKFCMVGLVSPGKNQEEALEAVNILVNEWGIKHFHLSIIGFKEKEYTAKLDSYIRQKGIEHYVTFMGECSDVGERLNTMDVGLMLSKNEAFGRVTVEYMMHGLAVIASDTGANREIVDDGVTGLLYHIGNSMELAGRMRDLMANPSRLSLYGTKGREKALEGFTSEKNSCQIFDIYCKLTGTNATLPIPPLP